MSDCMTQEDAMRMDNQQAINILKPLRDMMRDQNGCPISDAYFALDKAIKVLSAEPKKGKWILKNKESYSCECSVCKQENIYAYIFDYGTDSYKQQDLFCPNCGADMRGEKDE